MDGGVWWAAVHGVARSRTRLSDFTFTFHFHALEKEMALQCSCLENPRDGGACWAAISGVTQSWTRLKRLSSSSSSSSSSNYLLKGFPDHSVGKEPTCNAGDLGLIPGLGRSAGGGIGYPLQYSWASLMAQLVKNPPANFLSHQQSFYFRNEENEAQNYITWQI